MKVTKTKQSRIGELNVDDIRFGNYFSDHMLVCDHADGAWQEPEIKPYGSWLMSPASSVFHYGQAIFEGLKAYRDAQGGVFLFRPDQNQRRFNASAVRLQMPELPEEIFMEGIKTLVALDSDWVPPGQGKSLYIRPFMIATQPALKAVPSQRYRFAVICSPAGPYYGRPLSVIVARKYSRASSGGIGYAKAAANYAAAFYPTSLAIQEGYDQVIWTDSASHRYVEESGTMSIFFRIGDRLVTAPVSDRILDSVTRKSIITLAEKAGLEVEQRLLSVDEITAAYQAGTLKEAFGCGTAAVVSPIRLIHVDDLDIHLPELGEEAYSMQLRAKIIAIQYNLDADPFGWRLRVK